MGISIGIDLGNITSKISYLQDNDTVFSIASKKNNTFIIPSAISIEDNITRVGYFKDKKLQYNKSIQIKDYLGEKKLLAINGKEYSIEYLAAILIKKLISLLNKDTNLEGTNIVATVPANFNSTKRKSLRDALEINGLKNIKIITDATAAAIFYASNNQFVKEKVLIYNLSSKTLDISILDIFNDTYTIITSNNTLDISANIINKNLFETIINLLESTANQKIDLNNLDLMATLSSELEEAKKHLSFNLSSHISVKNILTDANNQTFDLNLDLKRNEFEYLINDLIDSSISFVEKTLNKINISSTEIDRVILVGGSTYMPIIKQKLKNIFNENKIYFSLPEQIVSLGASLYARNNLLIKENNLNEFCNDNIGIEIIDGKFDTIIKKSTKIPSKFSKSYHTIENNQEIADFKFYSGSSPYIKDNKFIGSFEVNDIPKDQKGMQHIKLEVESTLDGVLELSLSTLSTDSIIKKILSVEGLSVNKIEEFKNNLSIINLDNFYIENTNDSPKIIKTVEYNKDIEEKQADTKKATQLESMQELRIAQERQEQEFKITQEAKKIKEVKLKGQKKNQEKEKQIIAQQTKQAKKEESLIALKNQTNPAVDALPNNDSRDEEIYEDVSRLVSYYNSVAANLDLTTRKAASELLSDLLRLIKQDKIKEARVIEDKIISLIYKG